MKGTLKYVRRAVYAAVALGLVVVSIVEVNAAGVTVRAALTALAGVFLAYSAVSGGP